MESNVILVTGATGVLGREVVERARRAGVPVRALTRRAEPPRTPGVSWCTGDLLSGEGLAEAFAGVRTVIHCATDAKRYRNDLPAFEQLIAAARTAGVGHVVNISIVGIDQVPFPYYRVKLAGEQLLRASGLGWTNLRATQFPELLDSAFGALAKSPVVPMLSGARCQPVDQGEVAERLLELALGEPAGDAPELAGPKVYDLLALTRSWLRAAGHRRLVLPVPLPGRLGAALRSGGLTNPERAVGRRTWEDFLRTKVANP
ncbi:NAD(P)H-binding protein [Kitasatospora sp. NPDC002227]|uniref:SDR family oxidoreductase n=1 Tax=Kitasatospora sp. NPDC002227 TaxID=3154773 RepID=UPI00332D9A3F